MGLAELSLTDVRCFHRARLELHPGHNLIWGGNGSGKTSLLEAIFLLGRGRSFRTRNSERLIRHGEPQLAVAGRTHGPIPHALGVQVSRTSGVSARIDGGHANALSELSSAFPVQVIDPGVHQLVEEGASRRRRWLDWAVFHVEPSFLDHWLRYGRALRQRNAALKQDPELATAWDPELARLGELMGAARSRLIARLQPIWSTVVQELCGLDVELRYASGWGRDLALAQALLESRVRDAHRGLTHSGPHRADIVLRVAGRPARDILSRGQQKLVAIALTLSQLRLLRELTGVVPTLLLDDPAAELDPMHLRKFIDQVLPVNGQLILTSLSGESDAFGPPDRVFHVEQGSVFPV